MTYAQTVDVSRVRDGSTWWSVAIVIAIHVLLFGWLLTQRWTMPLRQAAADMVLVELSATAEVPVGQKKQGVEASLAVPSPGASASRTQNSTAAPRHDVVRKDLEHRVVTPEGTVAPGSAIVSLAPSNPVDGTAPSGLGTTAGTDAALAGGDGAKARGIFHAPEVTKRFRPDYPLDAYQARQEGSVDVMVTIGADARIVEAHVYKSSGVESLDRASVAAVHQYAFRAAKRGDALVEAQALLTIDWVILDSGASGAEIRPQSRNASVRGSSGYIQLPSTFEKH
jgi:TonB family protein